MFKHIFDLDYKKNDQLVALFKSINDGNTVLFLGAGASVTAEHRFLSQDIIEFFEDKKQISWGISNITDFVDALSENQDYSRDEFDNYVDECLRKLEVTPAHRTIARTYWREIITTNYDLLVEKAFTEVEGTHEEVGRLKIINTPNEYYGIQARNEIKYVKLHGCISNKRKYKLAFSTDDFKSSEKFYKRVLNNLKNISDNVTFLSAGYSYSDKFAKELLDKIDSFGFRERRIIYNIDPYINDAVLPKYSSRRICIIKATINDFFKAYEDWKAQTEQVSKLFPKVYITNNRNDQVYIPSHISRRVGDNLRQLNTYYRSSISQESEFYKGGEPDYNIILKNYDVVKSYKITEVMNKIIETINNGGSNSRLLPIFFLTGTFGTGKSTFAYRLLHRLNQQDTPTISFEILDPSEFTSVVDLKEIFQKTSASYIFLYINTIEINSVYKSMLELRNKLSIDGYAETKIAFIVTIRENILLKYREEKKVNNSFEIPIDCPFSKPEVEALVEKLKNNSVIQYRDARERTSIINKILKEFSGDSFISLLELVEGNKLIEDLLQAYYQLNEKCKKAFIFTSLLYQYKLLMPAGLLRSLISSDWEEFRADVIEKDGKGILIQEIVNSKGVDPDLYFRTKHPVISRRLIMNLLSDEEQRFNHIKSIITHLIDGAKNAKLSVDFLKSILANRDLPFSHVNKLYDLADKQLEENPYFLLHYAINLQKRQTEKDIRRAISKIQYAESISEKSYRNHYLIHRRGVLNFELAKLIFKNRDQHYLVLKYIDEARDFLQIKKAFDPFSSFSYVDLLNLEIWCLEKFEETTDTKFKRRIVIEELFDVALKTVFENTERILEIKNRYIEKHKFQGDEKAYLEFLEDYYSDSQTRPYALVLLFNHFLNKEDHDRCNDYLSELEELSLNADVRKLLLKYYGRNLNFIEIRLKFFDLIKTHPELEESENLRFNYFNFVAECYNKNFGHAQSFLSEIKEKFQHINPDFHQIWVSSNNEPVLFEATLRYNRQGKKTFYIPDLNLWTRSENWSREWKVGMQFDVELHFYIYGIRAKAINIISDEYEDANEEGNDSVIEL